jgi:hypothetical protein
MSGAHRMATPGSAPTPAVTPAVTPARPVDAPVRPPATPEVARARKELLEARRALGHELDELAVSTRASMDIPAKIRRDPVKAAALAGGAGFLVLGGPKRVLRAAGRLVPGRDRDPYRGLLPDEIEKVLRDTGVARDPRVRRAIENDFAEYLRHKGKQPPPSARTSLWRTYDSLVGPLGAAGARALVERLFAADATFGRPKPRRSGPPTG